MKKKRARRRRIRITRVSSSAVAGQKKPPRATDPDSVGRRGRLDDPGEERLGLREHAESFEDGGEILGEFLGRNADFVLVRSRFGNGDILCPGLFFVIIELRLHASSPPASSLRRELISLTNDTHLLCTKRERGEGRSQVPLQPVKTTRSVRLLVTVVL